MLTDNSIVPQLTIDQIAVSGILDKDTLVNIHYRGGMSAGVNFHWEINGSQGDIVITGDIGQMHTLLDRILVLFPTRRGFQ